MRKIRCLVILLAASLCFLACKKKSPAPKGTKAASSKAKGLVITKGDLAAFGVLPAVFKNKKNK